MNHTGQSATRSGEYNETEMVGGMSRDEFDEINENGAETVAGLTATSDALSAGDERLLLQVAAGGMMQLEASRVAVENATDEEVLAMAEAEVVEQTGLSEKLQEIAAAKGLTLPTEPDAETQAMIEQLQSLSDDEFDRAYIEQSGIAGHEKLDTVMSQVETEAEDADLQSLAAAAHPLVLTHLQVSRAILDKI